MKENNSKLSFFIISLLCSIIVGIVVPIVIENVTNSKVKFTIGEQIIITITLAIAIPFIEFIISYDKSLKYQKSDFEFWQIKHHGDSILHNVRSHFHKVIEDSNHEDDIFALYFKNTFVRLCNEISEVAEKQELLVKTNYFLNAKNVLKVFSGDNKFWWFTWQIDDPEKELFDAESWSQFVEKTTKMTRNGEINQIRAILILKDIKFINHPRVKKLLDFYKTNKGLECKILDKSRFLRILIFNSFNTIEDFGIYGNNLLFIEKYTEDEVSGYFIKNKEKIESYTNLYNELWNIDSITETNPSNETVEVLFSELVKFDKNYKCE